MTISDGSPTIESITIMPASNLSNLDRTKAKAEQEDFVEIRVVKNSPKRIDILPIKKGVKPTEGFRKAIGTAGLLNLKFS